MRNFSRNDVTKVQRLIDSFLVAYFSLFVSGSENISSKFTIIPLWMWTFFIYMIFSSYTKLYDGNPKRFFQIIGQWIETWIYTSSALVTVLYLSKTSTTISRLSSIIWLAISMITTLLIQIFIYKKRWDPELFNSSSEILFWGDNNDYKHFIKTNRIIFRKGTSKISWFGNLDRRDLSDQNSSAYLGGYSDMVCWLSKNHPSLIIFNIDNENETFILKLLSRFGCTSSPILFTSKWFHRSMSLQLQRMNGNSYLRIWGSGRSKVDEETKRLFDIVFALFSLIVLGPFFLIVGISIKITSPGPIFFKQSRNGLHGKEFKMYKFRSMKHDNSDKKVVQAKRHDERFTAVGKFIRRWSIDELPQLWNVLKGDMTVVGPRPHALEHNIEYSTLISGYMQRHNVKPGMTGLAQISGYRGETRKLQDMEQRIYEDLIYQNNWSIKGDIAIILETIAVLGSNKVY